MQQSKKYQNGFDQAALWRVYVYLISSTSMQKENLVKNSVRRIKKSVGQNTKFCGNGVITS